MLRIVGLPLMVLTASPNICRASSGRQDGTVVIVPKSACHVVDRAALELQYYVEEATGVRLPTMTEESVSSATIKRIYLGATRAALRAGIDPAKLARDAYHTQESGDVAYMVGRDGVDYPIGGGLGTSAGTVFAAYDSPWQNPYVERLIGTC
jgi:hypothetical protein